MIFFFLRKILERKKPAFRLSHDISAPCGFHLSVETKNVVNFVKPLKDVGDVTW